MTEPPLSRFAGQNPKPRPTDTVIVPNLRLTTQIVMTLIVEREIFTVEPSPSQDGVWHLGVFESGKQVAVDVAQTVGYSWTEPSR